jgi:ADP-heptose:LPS heptosyltransferase
MSRKTLVLAPARLADALPRLPVFAALARSGRVVCGLFREGQAAFEPTLMRWRKENTPASLALPIALPWGGNEGVKARALARLGFDEAVVLEPGVGAGLLAMRAGIKERWGYASGPAGLLLSRRVRRPDGWRETPLARREAELLAALGATWQDEARLDVPRGWQAVGRERLDAAKIVAKRKTIGIYAGKKGGGTVDGWPRAAFEELIRSLRQQRSDLQFVLIAQLEDLWQAVLIYEKTGKIHPVIGPDLPFSGLLATITCLDLLVAADSTLLHLAGALGVATLGLYEKDAALRRPTGDRHKVLEREPLRSLPPDEVRAAALELLERQELPALQA